MSIDYTCSPATSSKHTALVVHREDPLNIGTPPELARRAFITPQERFFVRNHGSVPQVNPYSYRLSVTGLVRTPLHLSLSDLKREFDAAAVVATLQCAGHRRTELGAVHSIPGELPWEADAIGNALWCGVPLRQILLAAGTDDGARHIAFTGLDEVSREDWRFGFGGSISLEKALSPEVLLAYEMNGEPLPPLHGFPLRVIVPGYIGARSVKWLANIHVQEEPSTNYFQRCAYRLFSPQVRAETADWEQAPMLEDLPLNSVICQPREGERLATGPVVISGYAITGGGCPVERVELSLDGGKTWAQAQMKARAHPWAWRFWTARLELLTGPQQISVRAWDADGRTQPEDCAHIWNWKGYLNNAWHRIQVIVDEE
jgi:sulfite oxidase